MEIEIKARAKDLKAVKSRLRKIGARKKVIKHQIDTYYLPQARRFTPLGRGVLRTRYDKISGQARLEYHRYISATAGEENELVVYDYGMLTRILNLLGAKKIVVVEKIREYYIYRNAEICLDKVRGLGNFVEVEIQGKDNQQNNNKILYIFCKLGISQKDFIKHLRYHAMLMKKKGYKHYYFK
ncbi:MAG: class IV adenylate cyclase [Patescibacteria group bacterium]